MSACPEDLNAFHTRSNKLPTTYFVQDHRSQEELLRLTAQHRMFTEAAGGVLAEQAHPEQFSRVLDIGCGPGDWLIEAAHTYPQMSFVGVDINKRMIEHARSEARDQGVDARIEFRVMDALTLPGIDNARFDLVNMRFSSSYLRTWEWPRIMREIVRVTRPGGTIRLTEADVIQPSNSEALKQLCRILLNAFQHSNHFFPEDTTGIVSHLPEFLTQQRCEDIQVRQYKVEYRAGTPIGDAFYQNAEHVFRTTRSFLQRWAGIGKAYDELYQQLLSDIQKPDFQAGVNFATAWGHTPSKPFKLFNHATDFRPTR